MEEQKYPNLRAGLSVVGADEELVGSVREVFRDVGAVESFGAVGIPPQQEGHDPVRYAYSEAMPGAGDDYITVEQEEERGVLYIPFSGIFRVDPELVVLAVDAEDIPQMEWTVRPDVLSSLENEYPRDTGADPLVA